MKGYAEVNKNLHLIEGQWRLKLSDGTNMSLDFITSEKIFLMSLMNLIASYKLSLIENDARFVSFECGPLHVFV